MVDLPEPDRPVNHSTRAVWPFCAACASRVTSIDCQWTLPDRRSAPSTIPAATVALVSRSIRMRPPRSLPSA